jgi:hypothetical protein
VGSILTTAAVMMCPHGGQVSISAMQSTVSAGAAIVRPDDMFTISGCPFMIGMSPHPCVQVEWQMPAMRVKAGSSGSASAVLTTSSIGLCKAADNAPQGTVMIQQTQTKASAQ